MLRDVLADRVRETRNPPPWAAIATIGQACWFFGNLYEAIVDVPALLADARGRRAPRLLGPGSPVRYYAPIARVTLVATAATLVERWRAGGSKPMITATAVTTGSAVAMTAYLVRTVNLRLLHDDTPMTDLDRRRLLTTWHRVNVMRLIALVGAGLAIRRR